MTASETIRRLREAGVLAVLRAPSAAHAVAAGDALVRGGVTGLEITYSTPDAAAAIRELVARHGDAALVGAGTVTTPAQAEEAADAGAAFLVSPGTDEQVARAMTATGRAVMTGALTPSEVMRALSLGADVVKIFPASLGGPALLRALRGPFPDAPLMPTGGVTSENIPDWIAAGAVAVGAGGDLCPATALVEERYDVIERLAREFRTAFVRATGGAA